MRALLSFPTHANCAEVKADAINLGLDAEVYPGRFTQGRAPSEVGDSSTNGTTDDEPNCWNPEADEAEKIGFPVVKTVCPTCPQRRRCQEEGYLGQLIKVQQADIALCTHKRIEYSGFGDLCAGRPYVSIHENPIDLLRPQCGSSVSDLLLIQALFQRLLNDPKSLDWFGNAVRVDDAGNKYESEEVARRRDRLYQFCLRIAEVVDDLLTAIEQAQKITEWPIPDVMTRPQGLEWLLFSVGRRMNLQFHGQPWRFVLAAAAGELQSAAILVKQAVVKGTADLAAPCVKSVTGFRSNPPAPSSVTWFNDATMSPHTLASVLNRPVDDQTPRGQLERQKKAVQILRDLTRKTSHRIFANVLRGVLADRPQFQRVGLITHRTCLPAIKDLGDGFRDRIVRTAYFGSGEERSSNAWHQECDLIVVAGTPRVPPEALIEYLMQIGRIGAAAREPVWGPVRWIGTTESGERVQVTGRGYYDEDWRQAHRDLVRATLVQAIGRGRGILETGCEVIVLSTEECGLSLTDAAVSPLSAQALQLIDAVQRASAVNSNKGSIENTAVSTAALAKEVHLSVRQTRELLCDLDLRGMVLRHGERGGWLPVRQADTEGQPA